MDVTASALRLHKGLSPPRLLQAFLALVFLCAQPALAQYKRGGTTRDDLDGGSLEVNLERLPKSPPPERLPRPITFSVIGDAPYGDAEIPVFQQVLAEHTQYSKARFVLHVGDTWGGSDPCTEDRFINMAEYLKVLDVPVFIVPGDNEWVDCPDEDEAWLFWSTYLMGLEQNFCGTPFVDRQGVRPENIAFVEEGVLFIGVNIVAGAPDPTMIDSATWVEQMLQKYGGRVHAAVVFSQAGPSSSRDPFFVPFVAAVGAFAKPVLHIHGDGHTWQYESPYLVPNLTRVQIDRTTAPPVHVTVTRETLRPFLFERDPWPAGTPLANNVPCVDAGPSQIVSAQGTANLMGSARDDGIPGNLTFEWRQMSGPGTAHIADPASPSTTVTFSEIGSYVFGLRGDDGFYSGVDTMTVIAADPSTVPTAVNDSYVVDEDSLLVVAAPGVLANDTHGGGLAMTVSLVTPPAAGSVNLAADGSFTYLPSPNFFGTETFYYEAMDTNGASGIAMVTLQVNPLNDPPFAAGETYSTTVGEALVQSAPGVLLNDSDPDGDSLTLTLERDVSKGTLFLWPDGSFNYTPRIDFIGTDSFDYRVSDGISDSLATASITVTPVLMTLSPVEDSYVRSTSASSNYGTSSRLNVEQDNTVQHTYLKFQVTGSGGAVQGARLRLYANDGSPDGGAVYTVSNDYEGSSTPWVETGITWNNAPLISGTPLASAGNVSNGTWVEWDVTSAITGNGTYSFGIQNASTNVVQYSSKEGGNPPELIIETDLPNDPPVAVDDAYSVDEDSVLVVGLPGVLANDTDDPRDILSTTLLTGPASGSLVLNSDGSFTYTPEADWFGSVSFTYQVQDTRGGSDTGDVSITVNAVNDPPVALVDSFSTLEDTPLAVGAPGVLGNDTDVEGQTLTATLVTAPAGGSVLLEANGSFVYTPAADFAGVDSFVYAANDSAGGSDSTTVILHVTPVNDGPVAVADSLTTLEDTPLELVAPGVLGNDVDVDGDSLSVTLVSDVTQGVLVLETDGSLLYTPAVNFHGQDSFVYAVSDTAGVSDSTTVTLTVSSVNDQPFAVVDSFTTAEDSTLVVSAPGVLGNDSDADGDSLVASLATPPASGTVLLAADGGFTYTPNANFHGSDGFQYIASDPNGGSDTTSVVFTVTPVNDAPLAVADSFSVDEDAELVVAAPGVLGNDSDVDGDSLSVAVGTGPANGTLVLGADGSFTYTPVAHFNGNDSFSYLLNDGVGGSVTGNVTLSVLPQNDAPSAKSDSFSVDEDIVLVLAAPGVLLNDSDIDGDSLQVSLTSGPTRGNLVLAADGAFTYTPSADFHGADAFTYTTSDGQGGSDIAAVYLTVRPVNDAPVALDDNYSVGEDSLLTVAAPGVLLNDSDVEGDSLSVAVSVPPLHGILLLQADGAFQYTPNGDYFGADSFTYEVIDHAGGSATATVSLVVNPVPDAPVALADSFTTDEDVALVMAPPGLLVNDQDVDGDSLSVVLVSGPASGELTLDTDGGFTYTPNLDFHGTDAFTYGVDDGTGRTANADVWVTIQPVNDLPVAAGDHYGTLEDIPLQVSAPGVLGNDGDPDADVLTVSVVTGPANGVLELNGDGSFLYSPAQDFHGADGFTYAVSDGAGGADSALVSIDVAPVNDAAVAVADSFALDEDSSLLEPGPGVLANDFDVEGDPVTALLVTPPQHGTLLLAADGGFLYTPEADFSGFDTFTYEARDDEGAGTTVDVNLAVNPMNDEPSAASDSYLSDEDVPLLVSAPGVLGNDIDVDGDSLSAVLVGQPAHGIVALAPDGSFSYEPAAEWSGLDSFAYLVSDGQGGSDVGSVLITVNAVNDPPVALADSFGTSEDVPLVVAAPGVLGNDADVEGDGLAAVAAMLPSNGTLLFSADGGFTYTPAVDFHGFDEFTYIVSDGNGGSDTTRVDLTVIPVPDAPIALVDSFNVTEDTSLVIAAPGVLGNDSDADGDALSAGVFMAPANGTLSLAGDGGFTYTPASNFAGSDGFTYIVSDGNGGSDTTSVALTVTPVNDVPVAQADSFTTAEDEPLVLAAPGLLSNDSDVDGDSLMTSLAAAPASGAVLLGPDGALTFTPNADFHGNDGFTYIVSDGHGGSDTTSVFLTVTPVNDPPVALADSFATAEDTPLVVPSPGVLANDWDVEGDAMSASVATEPTHGVLSLLADGSFTYTPSPDFSGMDDFTYTVADDSTNSAPVMVVLTITAIADAPQAIVDSFTTDEDVPLVVAAPGVLSNDIDPDGDSLSAILDTEPAHGSLSLASDGGFTYTPVANFAGSDGFTYIVSDGTGGSDTTSVSLDVLPVNDAPMAQADSFSTTEDVPLIVGAPGVLGNDGDVDGDGLIANVEIGPSKGSLSLSNDGGFTYTPSANFYGSDGFTYIVSDGNGGADTTNVALTVTPVPDAPVALADSFSVAEDMPLVVSAPGFLGNDSDAEADSLSASLGTGTTNGTLELSAEGGFTYTPNADFAGTDSFTYVVSDGNGGTDTGTVVLIVVPVNDAPVASVDSFTVVEDELLVVDVPGVLENDVDVDGDVLAVTVENGPANGTLDLAASGGFTFTPASHFSGSDGFTYIVSDGSGGSDTTSVVLAVLPVNDAPAAQADSFSTQEDVVLSVLAPGVLGNDTDVEGDSLSVSIDGGPENGNVTLNGDGSFDYTPTNNFYGTDAFTYTLSDGKGGNSTGTVTLTVRSINDAPVALADSFTTLVDSTLVVVAPGVLLNDSDVEGDSLWVALSSSPTHGVLSFSVDGSFTYTPNAAFEGTDSFTYSASDDSTSSGPILVTIEVKSPAAAVSLKDDSKRGRRHRLDDEEALAGEEGSGGVEGDPAVKPVADPDVAGADSLDEEVLVDLGPSGMRAYPNPFNARITLEYHVDQSSFVSVEIYNARGQRVRSLFQGQRASGRHHLVWDGRNETGSEVHSGIYFLRFRIGARTTNSRLVLLK